MSSGLRAIVSQRLVRASAGGRMPSVEIMLNTKLVSELIEKGEFTAIKEAMEKSLAEGSQTFEEDLARMIGDGTITRDEGLSHRRLAHQPDVAPAERPDADRARTASRAKTPTPRSSPRSRSTWWPTARHHPQRAADAALIPRSHARDGPPQGGPLSLADCALARCSNR